MNTIGKLSLLACFAFSAFTAQATTLEQIQKNGVLKIATGNYRPFEYYNKNNKLVGYDIDLAKLIAKKISVRAQFTDMQFSALIPSLQSGHADMVIAAMYINPQRKKVVDFAKPYMKTGMVFVVKKNDNSFKGKEDLNGKTVGAKLGATSEQVANQLQKAGYKFTIKTYQDTTAQNLDLTNGRIDVGINDLLNQLELNKVYKDVKIIGKPFTEANLGIAVQKNSPDLLKVINSVIDETQANGQAEALYQKWIIGDAK